jgi:hypothetical protein
MNPKERLRTEENPIPITYDVYTHNLVTFGLIISISMAQLFSVVFINICTHILEQDLDSISKSIIDAYGGITWAENNADGKGATFVFTLHIIGSNSAGERNNQK